MIGRWVWAGSLSEGRVWFHLEGAGSLSEGRVWLHLEGAGSLSEGRVWLHLEVSSISSLSRDSSSLRSSISDLQWVCVSIGAVIRAKRTVFSELTELWQVEMERAAEVCGGDCVRWGGRSGGECVRWEGGRSGVSRISHCLHTELERGRETEVTKQYSCTELVSHMKQEAVNPGPRHLTHQLETQLQPSLTGVWPGSLCHHLHSPPHHSQRERCHGGSPSRLLRLTLRGLHGWSGRQGSSLDWTGATPEQRSWYESFQTPQVC